MFSDLDIFHDASWARSAAGSGPAAGARRPGWTWVISFPVSTNVAIQCSFIIHFPPEDIDSDGDGLTDYEDEDDDNDGIEDSGIHGIGNRLEWIDTWIFKDDDDDDGDGVEDGDEDDDGDGVENDEDEDDDGDGIMDGDEDDDGDGIENDEDPDDDGDGLLDEFDELWNILIPKLYLIYFGLWIFVRSCMGELN